LFDRVISITLESIPKSSNSFRGVGGMIWLYRKSARQ